MRKYLVDRALCLIENILPLNWHIGVYDIRACARHFSVRGFRSRGVPLACEENSIVANTLPECNHAVDFEKFVAPVFACDFKNIAQVLAGGGDCRVESIFAIPR